MKCISALAFALCLSSAFAEDISRNYQVIDVLDPKNSTEETWTAHAEKPRADGSSSFSLIKGSLTTVLRQELHSYWFNEIRMPGHKTYLKEVLRTNPDDVEDGDSGFGFTEEKTVGTDEVVDSWPVFFKVKEGADLKSITYDAYVSGSEHMNILRDYVNGSNVFPLREVRMYFKDGKLISHVVFSRK